MLKVILTSLLIVSLSGCGLLFETKPLTQESSAQLKNKKVVVTEPYEIGLSSMTLTDVYLGIFSPDPSGDELQKRYGIKDPIANLKSKVLASWKKDTRFNVSGKKSMDAYTPSVDELTADVSNADFLLDVSSAQMFFTYKIGSFTEYNVKYKAKLQLVDLANKTVVAQKLCDAVSGDDKSYTYDDYLANNAKLLKEALLEASNKCAYELSVAALKS
ncbi:hypothetical protein QNI23_005105 [Bermanella sp. WJH001]|uniref:hypothetical protein n=1 Tax=Bermanella sp. WJH001 TaxID=3048005 RepID=UPI0024BED1EA|nr:hypothetical protein [Bermanella sp. WJH001]MDJ1539861.1 hypothetical protein [Bermanella sp. WJH001]